MSSNSNKSSGLFGSLFSSPNAGATTGNTNTNKKNAGVPVASPVTNVSPTVAVNAQTRRRQTGGGKRKLFNGVPVLGTAWRATGPVGNTIHKGAARVLKVAGNTVYLATTVAGKGGSVINNVLGKRATLQKRQRMTKHAMTPRKLRRPGLGTRRNRKN